MLPMTTNLDSQLCEVNLDDPIFYVNPLLAAVERFLAAEATCEYGISSQVSSLPLHQKPQKSLLKSFRRANLTDTMACANLSVREAEVRYPHLFAYV